MNPCTEDDTREGLHAKLRQVHGDVEGDASELTWKHKTRCVIICDEQTVLTCNCFVQNPP